MEVLLDDTQFSSVQKQNSLFKTRQHSTTALETSSSIPLSSLKPSLVSRGSLRTTKDKIKEREVERSKVEQSKAEESVERIKEHLSEKEGYSRGGF